MMARPLAIAILLAASLLLPTGSDARQAPPSQELLNRLQATAGAVQTLSCDLVQEKHLTMFKTVVTSKGKFHYRKPDQLRWEILEPAASGFLLNGTRGKRWNGRSGRTESFDIGREPVMKVVADQLFAWARADFTWLRKEYRITVIDESPVALKLEPLSPATAGFLRHLLITFSPDGAYVRTVEVHEKDGDFTRIRFLNAALNKPLKADLF